MIDLSTLSPAEITLIGSLFCVLLSMHFTVQLITQHLFYWKNPREQKAILIIVLMAPVYAINSFVSLSDLNGTKPSFMFLNVFKDFYAAFVVAKFLSLMYSYLKISMSKRIIIPDEFKGRDIHHSFPMTLFVPRTTHLDYRTLIQLKQWTWQFCIIRPVCSILILTLQLLGIYPAWLSWIFIVILNVSVYLALYSLVKFYHVFAKELEPHKPLTKVMCVIGIVFFCFWQGVVLEILVRMGIIKSHHFWVEVEQLDVAMQNVLVCLEMIVFSIIQQYAFHVAPYSGETEAKLRMNKRD